MSDTAHPRGARWKLEDAKARFSELVRRAQREAPQTVTVRGKEAAVVLSAEEFAALQPPPPDRLPWAESVVGLDLEGLDLSHPGRDEP
ncbi:MAG: type II toxin-antitoxin system Phd/YefM family antitoxin [Alphaproteobacteria bacterium]|nr:type II toxin-antitoxin system Phd/YefM family antitoxin [Alphaproteobacteria bacterium]